MLDLQEQLEGLREENHHLWQLAASIYNQSDQFKSRVEGMEAQLVSMQPLALHAILMKWHFPAVLGILP